MNHPPIDFRSHFDTNFHLNLLRQLPGMIIVKDKESRNIYSNHYTAKLLGYENVDHMLGLDAYYLRCPAVDSACDFIQQDQAVLSSKNELTILDIHLFAYGEPKMFITKKMPYKENNEILGTICHCTEIQASTLSHVCAALIQSDSIYYSKNKASGRSYSVGRTVRKQKISKRELDCVFYLMRGNTLKQIAKLLTLSPRTVETYLEQIKIKLNCSCKSDIIDYCLVEGLLNYIPSNVLNHGLSYVIDAY